MTKNLYPSLTWKGTNPTKSVFWNKLSDLKEQSDRPSIREMLESEPHGAEQMSLEVAGITVDISRNRIDQNILTALIKLAEDCNIHNAIEALFDGSSINNTEQRPALHSNLRSFGLDDKAKTPEVAATLQLMGDIARRINRREWLGFSGKAITDVVNIGIGGSDLGPRMVVEALKPHRTGSVNLHFVANIDPSELSQCLADLDPATTLFIVASKTFSTQETLSNAKAAKEWLVNSAPNTDISNQLIAISSNPDRVVDFGIKDTNILPMWDWVGGRYSLWSAIGLPIAIAIGQDNFYALLKGAAEVDKHFGKQPLGKNIPALLGLLDVWHCNFEGAASIAVLPYHHNLRLLPDYLQQLTMESNGKRVDREGNDVNYATSPVFWGSAGTVGQHSFHQLLHQGTQFIPVDFILPLQSYDPLNDHQEQLVSNCLSQAIALSDGKNHKDDPLANHRNIPGNRPSTLMTMDKLTPFTLGALIAIYEHRVFTSSVIWNINAFDQWGVELGKTISTELFECLTNNNNLTNYDFSIQKIIERVRKLNNHT